METFVEFSHMRFVLRDGVWFSLNWAIPGICGCAMEKEVPLSMVSKIEKHLAGKPTLERSNIKVAKQASETIITKPKSTVDEPKIINVGKTNNKKPLVRRNNPGGIKLFS